MSAKQWHRKRRRERLERELGQELGYMLTYIDADYEQVKQTSTQIKITRRERLYLWWWKVTSGIRRFFHGG